MRRFRFRERPPLIARPINGSCPPARPADGDTRKVSEAGNEVNHSLFASDIEPEAEAIVNTSQRVLHARPNLPKKRCSRRNKKKRTGTRMLQGPSNDSESSDQDYFEDDQKDTQCRAGEMSTLRNTLLSSLNFASFRLPNLRRCASVLWASSIMTGITTEPTRPVPIYGLPLRKLRYTQANRSS